MCLHMHKSSWLQPLQHPLGISVPFGWQLAALGYRDALFTCCGKLTKRAPDHTSLPPRANKKDSGLQMPMATLAASQLGTHDASAHGNPWKSAISATSVSSNTVHVGASEPHSKGTETWSFCVFVTKFCPFLPTFSFHSTSLQSVLQG